MDEISLSFYLNFLNCLGLFKFMFLLIYIYSLLYSLFSLIFKDNIKYSFWMKISIITVINYTLLEYLPQIFYLLILV